MKAGAKVIEILNQDATARMLMEEFNAAAKRNGLTKEEYAKAREIMLLVCISKCDEAMKVMAEEVYEILNK